MVLRFWNKVWNYCNLNSFQKKKKKKKSKKKGNFLPFTNGTTKRIILNNVSRNSADSDLRRPWGHSIRRRSFGRGRGRRHVWVKETSTWPIGHRLEPACEFPVEKEKMRENSISHFCLEPSHNLIWLSSLGLFSKLTKIFFFFAFFFLLLRHKFRSLGF